jgi:hypothetical protein
MSRIGRVSFSHADIRRLRGSKFGGNRRDAPPRLMSAVGSDSPLQLIFPAIDLVAVGRVRWFT